VTTFIGSLVLIVLVAAIKWSAVFNVTSPLAIAESNVAVLALGTAWLLNMFSAIVLRISYGYQDGYLTHSFQLLGSILTVISLGGMMAVSLLIQGVHLFGWQRPWLRPAWQAVDRAVVKSLLGNGTWHLLASVAYAAFSLSSSIIIAQIMGASVVPEFEVPLRVVTALLHEAAGECRGRLTAAHAGVVLGDSRGDDRAELFRGRSHPPIPGRAYASYRPSYPFVVLRIVQQECGLTAASVVADVGRDRQKPPQSPAAERCDPALHASQELCGSPEQRAIAPDQKCEFNTVKRPADSHRARTSARSRTHRLLFWNRPDLTAARKTRENGS